MKPLQHMAPGEPNPKVEWFFDKATQWQDEYQKLREIALGCGLVEELRWGCPCYNLDGGNVVLIHGFKEYCALLFMKGVLLSDPDGLLIIQTENVQSARQIRFTGLADIVAREEALGRYIREAMEVERAGLKVAFKKTTEFSMPEEFQAFLDQDPALRAAFEALTPGRQRGYLLHFGSAKQSKTRIARIEKYLEKIMAGKGLED